MAKNIALCFDGTWNCPSSNTNVVKIFRSILAEDKTPVPVRGGAVSPRGDPNIKWYDKGVGTKFGNIFRGGFTGRGLAKNILEGYKFLVDNYEEGDHIYLFGFSRGAYTARSLAGLIRNIGILHSLNAPKDKKIEDSPVLMNGFRIYRRRDAGPDTEEAKFFRLQYSHDKVEIKFLGVWETVGAMGFPSKDLDKVDLRYGFHDTTLSSMVKNAYHALAVDETRPEFIPTLWTSKPKGENRLEQVWFAGVHSEIGGGKRISLTNIPLRWMQEKAMENGLALDPAKVVCIDKQAYLREKVSNHFDAPWKNGGRNLFNLFSYKALLPGQKPHVRPIGGTQVECVHDLVHQKNGPGSNYQPGNHGLTSTDRCPPADDDWECGS